MGDALVLTGGAKWQRNRKLIKPAFGRREIRGFYLTFRKLASELVQHWEVLVRKEAEAKGVEPVKAKLSLKVDDFFSKITTEGLMRCSFMVERENWLIEDHVCVKHVGQYFKSNQERYTSPLGLIEPLYLRTNAGKKFLASAEGMKEYSRQVIRDRRAVLKNRKESDEKRICLVDILLTAEDADGNPGFTDEDLVDECNMFFVAGYDTTMVTLSWFMHCLSANPDAYRRCQEEVDDVFAGRDEINVDDLARLTYTTQCLKETLRLYPPTTGVSRRLTEDLKVDGYTIPEGATTIIHIGAVQRHPEIWEKPNEFYPEHFSSENEAKRSQYAFLPFIAGPRRCLGEPFAMEEMKTISAYILRHFEFQADPEHVVKDKLLAILVPENGVKVLLSLR